MRPSERLERAAQIKKALGVPHAIEAIAALLAEQDAKLAAAGDIPFEQGRVVEYDPADGLPLFTHSLTLHERRTKLRDAILASLTEQPITLTLLRRLEAAIAEHVI